MYSILSGDTGEHFHSVMNSVQHEVVREPASILSILTRSREAGTTVGICAALLGAGIHLTSVEDLLIDEDIVIVLKPYDATGCILSVARLRLSDIDYVLPFNSTFINPFFKSLG